MANEKWVLVHVSTRAKLPQRKENWLGIDKQWQITRAIESSACGKKKKKILKKGMHFLMDL